MSRRFFAAFVLCLQMFGSVIPFYAQEDRQKSEPGKNASQKPRQEREDDDADLPFGVEIEKSEYKRLRNEHLMMLRGLPYPKTDARNQAIYSMMRQEIALRAQTNEVDGARGLSWTPLGPAPIPNGSTVGGANPVSGRTVAIAVHPTNPDIAYVGTAQGGTYRTLNGGTSWTPLLDNALSLATGSIAIAPSDPSIVYVGTGEAGFSLDSFFGVGVYRITNADSANPVVAGPIRLNSAGQDVFTGRSIGKVVVHPTDPNIIFVVTVTGVAGLGSSQGAPAPSLGLYRSTNALAGSPVFEKIPVGAGGSRPVLDAVIEPGNPNRMFLTLVDINGVGDGGVYYSDNALAATPAFTKVVTTSAGAELGRAELAINKVGNTVTVYAATGTGSGTVYKSTYDAAAPGTPTFAVAVDNNFCSGQCFYDQAIAVDPTDANKVYLGGSPTLPFGRSTNGGTTFPSSSVGLHVDSHAIAVAPSNPNIIYFGSDGGIWKSINAGANWINLNNSTFSATQFQSIAVHPVDRNYTLGGTQDNGTNYLFPNGTTWLNSDGGDGGFIAIDSNSTTPQNTVSYHTYFNRTNLFIGFARALTTDPNGNGDPFWNEFLGCGNGATPNGINCADPVLFYAPMVLGPGNPNTVYMGTNTLYRSVDRGTTMPAVSQALPARISAITISKQNDNVRVVGLTNGQVWATTNGSSTLTNITGTIPARYVGRIAIDPTNAETAYVALGDFGLAAGQHVYKTTNLSAAAPIWTPAGSGIPDVPTNALVIDPANPNTIFAGTDIGVFRSNDGGASWTPFSDGLPRVTVFELAIQPTNRILRAATHGKGIYEIPLDAAAAVRSRADFDGDGKTDFSVFRNGDWYVQRSTGGFQGATWGTASDVIAPGDYDGDNKADLAIYRPNGGGGANFFAVLSETNIYRGAIWGTTGDIVRPGDYDGDNKTDIAVYRPSDNTYYALPTAGGAPIIQPIGAAGDIPVVLNYDSDNKADFGIFRPSNGLWSIRKSTDGAFVGIVFGQSGDVLVPADYDNDNKEDIAVFRNGLWAILLSTNGQTRTVTWGQAGDIAVPGDYDGDGADDVAVFRGGSWFALRSSQGFTSANFGQTGDVPIPQGYIP